MSSSSDAPRAAGGSRPSTRSRRASRTGRSALAFCAVSLVGVLRIVHASSTSYQTTDEGYHVGCALRWMQGRYGFGCLDHPPLARIAAGVPLTLAGVRSHEPRGPAPANQTDALESANEEGSLALREGDRYERNLATARFGMIPFFLLASATTWLWAQRNFGFPTAVASTALLQNVPHVLASAGLVTTDMAAAAFLPMALLCSVLWLEKITPARSIALGASVGLAVLAKHSTALFFPAAFAAIVLVRLLDRDRAARVEVRFTRRALSATAAVVIAFLVVFAGYRFQRARVFKVADRPHLAGQILRVDSAWSPGARDALYQALESPLPAGDLFNGLRTLRARNANRALNFFAGRVREGGSPAFFPTLFLFKTPLAFLALVALGVIGIASAAGSPRWEPWAPAVAALAIMAVVLPSNINIGLRHVLPIYPLLAVIAGHGTVRLFTSRRWPGAAGLVAVILVLWTVGSSVRAHPEYLAYFNELAGAHPERIAVDSDLDWGQDIKGALARLHDLGAREVHYECLGCTFLSFQGPDPIPMLPAVAVRLVPYEPATGWVMVSEWTMALRSEVLRRRLGGRGGAFDWLERFPFTRIGRSIRLYHIGNDASLSGIEHAVPPTGSDPTPRRRINSMSQ